MFILAHKFHLQALKKYHTLLHVPKAVLHREEWTRHSALKINLYILYPYIYPIYHFFFIFFLYIEMALHYYSYLIIIGAIINSRVFQRFFIYFICHFICHIFIFLFAIQGYKNTKNSLPLILEPFQRSLVTNTTIREFHIKERKLCLKAIVDYQNASCSDNISKYLPNRCRIKI